jgi:hypothetical protein
MQALAWLGFAGGIALLARQQEAVAPAVGTDTPLRMPG